MIIADVESKMKPNARNLNENGSEDIGLMQVNSSWLPQLRQYGITRESLFDPCLNVHIGAWVLAQKIQRHGFSWPGFAAYHSATPSKQRQYQQLLVDAYQKRFETK